MLRSVDWQFVTNVSVQRMCSIYNVCVPYTSITLAEIRSHLKLGEACNHAVFRAVELLNSIFSNRFVFGHHTAGVTGMPLVGCGGNKKGLATYFHCHPLKLQTLRSVASLVSCSVTTQPTTSNLHTTTSSVRQPVCLRAERSDGYSHRHTLYMSPTALSAAKLPSLL
jgi:hypothetical protein